MPEEARSYAAYLYIYAVLLAPKFLQNLLAKGLEQEDSLPYCLYYFIAIDHGLLQFFSKFRELMSHQGFDPTMSLMTDLLSKVLVRQSLSQSYDSKADWKETSKSSPADAQELIAGVLSTAKGRRGKRAQFVSLDDLLVGNEQQKTELKKLILNFLDDQKATVDLGCLLYILEHLSQIRKCEFATFLQALSTFTGRDFGCPDRATQRYTMIKANEKALSEDYARQYARNKTDRRHEADWSDDYNSAAWKHIRKVVSYWMPRFSSVRETEA